MRNEHLKILTGILTMFTAFIIFYVFAEKSGLFFLSEKMVVLIGIGASAYAAFFSLYISRKLERKRMNKKIFIIYSHKDKEYARKLTHDLKEMGYNPWLDEHEIVPGQNWVNTVYQAIENSSVALYLSSKNTEEQTGFATQEMKAAREILRAGKKSQSPIIPIYLEDSKLPKELLDIHAVKLFEDNGMEQLDKGLKYLFNNGT
jgi:hypothetical protein